MSNNVANWQNHDGTSVPFTKNRLITLFRRDNVGFVTEFPMSYQGWVWSYGSTMFTDIVGWCEGRQDV